MNNKDSGYELLARKLDLLIRLTALSYVSEKKQQQQIMMLNAAGFQPKEIADLLGTTGNTVNVALSNMRKMDKKKGRRSSQKSAVNTI